MDWNYIEDEIIETILWKMQGNNNFEKIVDEVFLKYSKEFPKFKNNLRSLKMKFSSMSEDVFRPDRKPMN